MAVWGMIGLETCGIKPGAVNARFVKTAAPCGAAAINQGNLVGNQK
jgi:hypothetical protein